MLLALRRGAFLTAKIDRAPPFFAPGARTSLYCAAILDGLGAGERGEFFCVICGSLLTARADLVPLVPDHDEQDEPTPTQAVREAT